MDASKKATLADLKSEFIAKCLDYEREQPEMCDLKMKEFLVKLKSDLTVNQTKLKEKTIVSYFEQKLLVHSKVLPSMCRESTIVRIIFQLGDDKLIKVFYPMRSNKLETILNRAEFEDSLES